MNSVRLRFAQKRTLENWTSTVQSFLGRGGGGGGGKVVVGGGTRPCSIVGFGSDAGFFGAVGFLSGDTA